MRKTLILAILLAATPLMAMTSGEDDATSLSYISYMERFATVQPAEDDETLDAIINMPIVPGDRIDTARDAHVEIQLSDTSLLWLDEYTSVSFDAIAFSRGSQEDRTVLYLADGTVMLEIPETAPSQHPTRLDCGSATVYLTVPGLYRATRLANGALRLEVWEGLAEASTATGGALIHAGTAAELDGSALVRTEDVLTRDDTFAGWVAMRRQPPEGDSTLHVDAQYAREAGTLDQYGTWVYIDSSDIWAWQPDVSGPWAPYTYGRWYWTPAGWSWIPYEPWGALPYHYGSWFFDVSFGWVWCWGSVWGPAWVDWMWWPGYVGWCPSGYYDWWYWNCYYYGYPPYYGGPPYHGHPPHDGHPPDGGGPGNPPHPQPGERVSPPENGPRPGISKRTAMDSRPLTNLEGGGRVGDVPPPGRFAANLEGEIPLDKVDPMPWRVVPTQDFESPHIGRLAQPLEDVVKGHEGAVARVVNGPLLTDPPRDISAGTLIESGFRKLEGTATRDLTPILSRNPSLDRATLDRYITPTTTARLVQTPVRAQTSTSPRTAELNGASGAASRPEPAAWHEPNIHRSLLGGSPGLSGRPATGPGSTGSGGSSAPRSSSTPILKGGFGGSARRPVGLPSSGSSSGGHPSVQRSGTPSSRTVVPPSGSSSPTVGRSGGASSRSVSPSSGSSSWRRPVTPSSTSPTVGRSGSRSSRTVNPSSSSSSWRRSVSPSSRTPVRRYTPSSRSVRPIGSSRSGTWRSPASRSGGSRTSSSSHHVSPSRGSSHQSPVRVTPRGSSHSWSRRPSFHSVSPSRGWSSHSSGSSHHVSPRR